MTRVWAWAAVTMLALAAAAAVLVWPLSGMAVSGNALRPDYSRDFVVDVSTYEPLSDHPTARELQRAGIVLPTQRVADRRREAAEVIAVGLIVTVGGVFREAWFRKV